MEKILNFRDLGGIATLDGRKTKKGLFYRCALLEEASASDVEKLKAMGIKLVFDYRNPEEVPDANGYPYNEIGATRLSFTMLKGKDKLYRLQNRPNILRVFSKVSLDDIKATYRNLPFGNEGYKRMVAALVEGEVPFIQHCTAGKDRTGVGSALLLGILGVRFDEIVKDYLVSIQIENEIMQRASQRVPRILSKWLYKKFGVLFRVEKELLEAAIDEMLTRYGSFENYIEKEYNLTPEKVAELRARYTE